MRCFNSRASITMLEYNSSVVGQPASHWCLHVKDQRNLYYHNFSLPHLLSPSPISSLPPSLPPCSLCRVLDSVQVVPEVSPSQKAVFLFLHTLYTNCSYLQTTFRSRFGHHCMQLGDSILGDSFPPLSTDPADFQKILQTKPRSGHCGCICVRVGVHIYVMVGVCMCVMVFCMHVMVCLYTCDDVFVCV